MSRQERLDMFAAMAMQALMGDESMRGAEPDDVAAAAYEQAEAMLVESDRRAAKAAS
jgi:hypothetical protein